MLSYNDITESQQKLIDALYGENILAIAPKGFGKCVCAQTAAQELIEEGFCKRVLVVAPLKVAELTWAKEHEKWQHLWAPAMAVGTEGVRVKAIESGNAIVIINNENLVWMIKNFDLKALGFNGLVVDESTKYKSSGSGKVRALRPLLKNFVWRVGLSASPVTETGMEIYAQVLLVDAGAALGRVQDVFRRKYFMQTDFSGYKWDYQPGGEQRLAEALKDVVYMADGERYEKNLPALHDHWHFIILPDAARSAYDEMARDLILEIEGDDEIDAPSMAIRTLKLQQISAGAVYNERGEAVTLHNEKIQWLLNNLKPFERVLISYWFQFELSALRKALPGLKVLADDPVGLVDAWNRGEVAQLAVHPSSAGHGINLQDGGHTLICLGPVWSLDLWDQLVGRLRRRGQQSAVVHRHVVVAWGTVDEIMLERLSGKKLAEGRIMDHIRERAEGFKTGGSVPLVYKQK